MLDRLLIWRYGDLWHPDNEEDRKRITLKTRSAKHPLLLTSWPNAQKAIVQKQNSSVTTSVLTKIYRCTLTGYRSHGIMKNIRFYLLNAPWIMPHSVELSSDRNCDIYFILRKITSAVKPFINATRDTASVRSGKPESAYNRSVMCAARRDKTQRWMTIRWKRLRGRLIQANESIWYATPRHALNLA